MKRLFATFAGCAAIFAVAPASATVFTPADTANFSVAGNIASGPVTATLNHNGIAAGAFSDSFLFTLDQTGVGSGAITTGTTLLGSVTDLDITSVTVNGLEALKTLSDADMTESFTISGVPINFGVQNTITVTGTSRGLGSYGGNATFEPVSSAVPEPAAWGMMIGGFGLAGGALRRRRAVTTKVSFA